MKWIFACIAFFTFFALSCTNQSSNTAASSSSPDSLSASSLKIKASIDSSIVPVLAAQTKIQRELDSLGKLIKNTDAVTSLSVSEFKALQSGVGKRMSLLEKITKLEPMQQEFNTIYTEINNTSTDPSVRKEKFEKLAAFSGMFLDSIKSTIYIIENGK